MKSSNLHILEGKKPQSNTTWFWWIVLGLFIGIGIGMSYEEYPPRTRLNDIHNEAVAEQNKIDSLQNISKDWNNHIDFQVNVYHNLQDSIAKLKAEQYRQSNYKCHKQK